MTAEDAGRAARGSAWAALRTLKDQWLLLVFMTGSLLWLRDTYARFEPLPGMLAEHGVQLVELHASVEDLRSAIERDVAARTGAVLAFPGEGHEVEDAAAGEWTLARLVPTRPLRGDCHTVRIDAWMIDAGGRWFTVPTDLRSFPTLTEDTDLAFAVQVPAEAAAGRAQALVQFTQDCGTHLQVDAGPRLPFRVIAS